MRLPVTTIWLRSVTAVSAPDEPIVGLTGGLCNAGCWSLVGGVAAGGGAGGWSAVCASAGDASRIALTEALTRNSRVQARSRDRISASR